MQVKGAFLCILSPNYISGNGRNYKTRMIFLSLRHDYCRGQFSGNRRNFLSQTISGNGRNLKRGDFFLPLIRSNSDIKKECQNCLKRKQAAEYTLIEDRKYIREEPPFRAALSCIYAHRRERYYITTQCRACGGSSCIATGRSPERRRRARLPLSGTVLLQKRNVPHP